MARVRTRTRGPVHGEVRRPESAGTMVRRGRGMQVLGINSAYHESAAALVRDGEIVAAAEEERWNRRKHGKAALPGNPDELPASAIGWVLAAAGVRAEEIDRVAYGFAPRARLATRWADPPPLLDPAGWGTAAGERAFEDGLARLPARLAALGIRAPLAFVPHHRAHAASAFYPSPFERAAVLAIDGIGEHGTAWLGRGDGARLHPLERIRYPHSLGLLWERVSVHLGFGEYGAPKVMGLAAWGDPDRFGAAIARLLSVRAEEAREPGAPPFEVDLDLARFRAPDTASLDPLFGPARRPDEPPEQSPFADLAAALQRATEEALLATARRLARITGERRLAYAGGVALNCVANARLEREGPFDEIYIPPAPHDAGTAVGAAIEVALRAGSGRRSPAGARRPPPRPTTPFLGPRAAEAEVVRALETAGLPVERSGNAPAEAAGLLAEGALVGWFDGALEFGPRALGHRSILADPRQTEVRDRLNRCIKHREPFRPFGAAVLDETAMDWFEIPARAPRGPSRDLMLFAYPVRPACRGRIPAVVHRDGSCRIQTVEAARDARFHRLIARFRDLTGVPLVLNTSFNDAEPIVRSPEEAIRTFIASGLDALFLGDIRAARR